MLLQPITVQFSKSTLKPSVNTLSTGPGLSNFGDILFNPSYYGNVDTRKNYRL